MNKRLREFISQRLPKMDGWCTVQKAITICNLILEHKPKVAVELGVFAGRSLFPIAMALEQNGGGIVYGIDPWTKASATEGENGKENDDWWNNNVDLERIFANFVSEYALLGLSNHCRWMRDTAEDAAPAFSDGTVDFLHQDSNHSELVSCRQVDVWFPKLSPSAIWVLDDTDWATQHKAVEKIKALGFSVFKDAGTFQIYRRIYEIKN